MARILSELRCFSLSHARDMINIESFSNYEISPSDFQTLSNEIKLIKSNSLNSVLITLYLEFFKVLCLYNGTLASKVSSKACLTRHTRLLSRERQD